MASKSSINTTSWKVAGPIYALHKSISKDHTILLMLVNFAYMFSNLPKHLWEVKARYWLTSIYRLCGAYKTTHLRVYPWDHFRTIIFGSLETEEFTSGTENFFIGLISVISFFPFFNQVFDEYCWWSCTIVFLWLAAVFFKWIFVLDSLWNLSAAFIDVSW